MKKQIQALVAIVTTLFLGCAPSEQKVKVLPPLDEPGWAFVGMDTSKAILGLRGDTILGFSVYREYQYKGRGYEGFISAQRWLYVYCLNSDTVRIADTSVKVIRVIN